MTNVQDRALFCEYLPSIILFRNGKKYTRSEGTLLLIFESGSVCCYPINDKTLRSISEYAVALSTESTLKPRNKSRIEYSSIDAQLPRKDLVKIDVLKFPQRKDGTPIHPRKITLSPNKKFLLIIGVEYSKQRKLIVYKIQSNSNDPLQPIFYDRSLTYFDACFSSDSKHLIALPSRFPGFVFMFKLPRPQNLWNDLYLHNSSEFIPISSRSRFTPRSCGPLFVVGPAKNSFGKPLEMTHISGSINPKLHTFSTKKKKKSETNRNEITEEEKEEQGKKKQKEETQKEEKEESKEEEEEEEVEVEKRSECDFVTWNDLGYGEYCLWSLKSAKYVYKNYSFLEKKFVNKDKLNIEKQFEDIYDDSDDSECYYEDNSSEEYYYSSTESSDELNKLKWNDNRNDWSLDEDDDDEDDDEYDEYSFEYSDQVSETEDLQITESTKKEKNINSNQTLKTEIKNNSIKSETKINENGNNKKENSKKSDNNNKEESNSEETGKVNKNENLEELIENKNPKKLMEKKTFKNEELQKEIENSKKVDNENDNENKIESENKNEVDYENENENENEKEKENENENENKNQNNDDEKLSNNSNQEQNQEEDSEEWDNGDEDEEEDSEEVEDSLFLNNQRVGRRERRKRKIRDGFYFFKNFEYFPRLLFPSVHKTDQINEKTQPTAYILDMQFSPPTYSINNDDYDEVGEYGQKQEEQKNTYAAKNKFKKPKLFAVIIRHSFRNSSDNGLGISMVDGSVPERQEIEESEEIKKNQRTSSKKGSQSKLKSNFEIKDLGNNSKVIYHKNMNVKNAIWYRASKSNDRDDFICAKWTNTMLIGQEPSASIVLRGKGVYELVDYCYGSEFQALYSYFVKNVVNFVTVTSYHRFWLTKNGELRLIIVNPTVPSLHPEWKQIFETNGNQKMDNYLYRQIGRRVGYYINKIQDKLSDSRGGRTKGGRSKGRRGGGNQYSSNNDNNKRVFYGFGMCESCVGLHLYRCFFCGTLLTRPLQCGMTLSAVYCSKECQANHWKTWKMRITHHELKK
ncbi:hypothetical protein M0813_03698 [Anaeramoeba flamelloides]|uniref:MYND-type domain-containing protein n=1 Tax=Anaeramoeba flamelloides TaxID=1746091 RepID=A0ABQ8XSG7_9EUKA|nr:hypothetical protein M0813_03698 [Anaeramoeba flamelloides]